jgi:DNA-binding response OmpR family regulator
LRRRGVVMALRPQPLAKFNLSQTSILMLEGSHSEMDLYIQILSGFGAKHIHRCMNRPEAEAALLRDEIDLIVIDAKLPDGGDGYDFVKELRYKKGPLAKLSLIPVLMIAGHTPPSKVALARDCGAHFVIRKPVRPDLLLERILWIAQESRPFVECDAYVGPERRFQYLGPPDGVGRRRDDLSAEVGESTTPDMDQEMVDQLFKARRVAT